MDNADSGPPDTGACGNASVCSAGVSRRSVLGAAVGAAPGGFTLALALDFSGQAHASVSAQPAFTGAVRTPTGAAVNAWLTIAPDNTTSLRVGVTEMGQGSLQALAQILCEDLMVDPRRVQLIQGRPTQAGSQPVGAAFTTGGSGAVRNNYVKLRTAGAQAREALVAAAMNAQGDGTRANFTINDGVITHTPSGTARTYGSVASVGLAAPTSASLVPDSQLRSIGQSIPRADIPAKVTGRAIYGIDVRIPGMLHASLKHCPVFGGTLSATPASSATMAVVPLRVHGSMTAPNGATTATMARGRDVAGNINAVAVVMLNPAGTTWDAMRAARNLKVSWKLPPDSISVSSDALLASAKALLVGGATPYRPGATTNEPATAYTVESQGATQAILAATPATNKRTATYSVPLLPHACMEVLNATVKPTYDGSTLTAIEVWAPTQVARTAQLMVMALCGLPEAKVVINVTLLGGGLGRKLEVDFISQAVQTALAVKRPVKLTWSREEDFSHDQFRPMAAMRASVAFGTAGYITAWSYRVVSDSIVAQRGRLLGATGDTQSHEGASALPYKFGARLTEHVTPRSSPIPVGYWRSVGASINTFAVESMIDEIAAAAKVDPVLFRQTQLSDPRWINVLNGVVAAAGGSLVAPRGLARGVAIGAAFNSIVATIVEVGRTSTGALRVARVWIAIDCGLVINPDQVEAQLMGGVIHGINATLYGRQRVVSGAAQHRNFSTNRMVLRSEAPQTQVVIVRAPGAPSYATAVGPDIGGVGELGVPTLAPALANAWFRLTARRVRDLPFFPSATMSDD